MVYSNDEIQDKLNNSADSNANKKAVRDLSASNSKNAKEEINRAKQELLILEAIENNAIYKRLKQTLAKTTNGRISVSPEEIAEVYSSMVSPSTNTVGNKGVFFVDEGIISMAVSGICYDISIEENGLVLNVDGTLNVEGTKRQVAMISGGTSHEEMDAYKAKLLEEKSQYLDKEKSKYEILSGGTNSKAGKLLEDLSQMSKPERDAYLNSEEGKKRFEEAINDEKFDKAVEFFRKVGNLETADDVTFMHLAGEASKLVDEMQGLQGKQLEQYKKRLAGITGQLKKAAKEGNKEAIRFINDNGQPDLRSIISTYREFVDIYSAKENIQFMQQASEGQLHNVKNRLEKNKKLKPEDRKFVEELVGRNLSLILSEDSTVRNGTDAKDIAIAELGILYPDSVDENGRINVAAVIKLYNFAHNPPVNSVEEIIKNARAMQEKEVDEHISGLVDKIKTNTFEERTTDDLNDKEKRRKKQREDRKKQREEEEEHANDSPLKKLERRLDKFRNTAKIENIADALNSIYQKAGVESPYQSAIIASVYLYNRKQAFKAQTKGDGIELAEFERNYKMIEAYIRRYPEQYKEIVDKDGTIKYKAMENINQGLFEGIDVSEMLKTFGMTSENLTEIFEEAQTNQSQFSLLSQGAFKTVKNSIKAAYEKIKPKKLLNASKDTQTSERTLSQVEIDALFAANNDGIYSRLSDQEQEAYEIDLDDFEKQVDTLLNGGLNRVTDKRDELEARVAGQRVLSQEQIDELQLRARGLDKDASFDDRIKADVNQDAVAQLIKESQERLKAREKAVQKVDIGTMKKMAFEICQKNNLPAEMVNGMSVPELQELISIYGNEQDVAVELQGEQPVSERNGEVVYERLYHSYRWRFGWYRGGTSNC